MRTASERPSSENDGTGVSGASTAKTDISDTPLIYAPDSFTAKGKMEGVARLSKVGYAREFQRHSTLESRATVPFPTPHFALSPPALIPYTNCARMSGPPSGKGSDCAQILNFHRYNYAIQTQKKIQQRKRRHRRTRLWGGVHSHLPAASAGEYVRDLPAVEGQAGRRGRRLRD